MASAKTRQRLASEPWRKVYGTKRWKDARRRALIRAGRMCQHCGGSQHLDVHHLIALKDGGAAYDPANLEVLCRSCHRSADNAVFEPRPSTSRPVDVSLPDSGKSAQKSAREPENPDEHWESPDGRRWSRDWGGGVYVVDGQPVDASWLSITERNPE